MQDSTEEIARRVLESVLRRLDGGAAQTAAASPANDSGAGAAPLIVILLGDRREASLGPSAHAGQPLVRPTVINQSACGCQNNSHAPAGNSLQSTHPGLERFDLPNESPASNAPRTCFMEPGRACVGSGACEMRGY